MISGLASYPTMKGSTVPWIGALPKHWKLSRLKQVCSRSALYGANVPATSYAATGVRFLRTTDITPEGDLKSTGKIFVEPQSVGAYLLADGDLLISRSGTVGRSFLYDAAAHGSCAYAGYLVRFVPSTQVVPRFLFLFTQSRAFADFLRVSAISSTIENVNGAKYANAPIPVPPLGEQIAIVRFLDHCERRIRRAIRAKQRLIALLNEQKQAVIHRAVTHGLDPNVRLKASGVEGLGDVPDHWEVKRAKFIFNPVDVRSTTGAEELLTVSARKGVVPREGSSVTMFQAASYIGHKLCWPQDLVINSLWAWANGLGFARRHGIVSTAYGVYRLRAPQANQWKYLDFALRSGAYQWQLQARSKGIWISRLQLSDWNFLDMPVLLPPQGEAKAITRHLERETIDQERAISNAETAIALLEEYRTRLIADVVTGKLDVREAAARLPEELDEPGPFREIDVEQVDEPEVDDLRMVEV